jgi:Tfp pilus assembly protein PilX
MKKRIAAKRGSERGIALIMALFALLLLSAIAMGMMYMADTETSVNNNYRDAQVAFFASQGGLQEARLRLMNDTSTALPRAPMGNIPFITPTTMPGAASPTGLYYITNPAAGENVRPWDGANQWADTQLCKERYGLTGGDGGAGVAGVPCGAASLPGGVWYTNVASMMGGGGNTQYKWVRISKKKNKSSTPFPVDGNPATGAPDTPICWDGKYEFLLPGGNPTCEAMPIPMGGVSGYTTVYTVTSLAVTGTGARRMTQMEMAFAPPIYANAAVDSQDHVTLNGQLTVNGYDNCSCMQLSTCDGQGKNPGTGVQLCTDPPQFISRPGKVCDNSKWAIYSAGSVDNPVASETVVAGPTPPIAENQSWPYNIPDMINQYKANALNVTGAPYGYTCTPANPPSVPNGNCGTQTGQTFGVPPNFPPTPPDAPLGPLNMAEQVTYVPGDLKITASSVGNGILIIDGDLDINGGLQFYGLILVKGVVKFTGGGAQNTNIFGAVLAGQESLVDNVLGGSAVIQFDQCSLIRKMTNNPPVMITQREVMY